MAPTLKKLHSNPKVVQNLKSAPNSSKERKLTPQLSDWIVGIRH